MRNNKRYYVKDTVLYSQLPSIEAVDPSDSVFMVPGQIVNDLCKSDLRAAGVELFPIDDVLRDSKQCGSVRIHKSFI